MDLRYTKQAEGSGGWKVLEERIYGGTGASHQPTTIKSASGDATAYQYNAFGQVTLITNPKGEQTLYNYDTNGLLTSVQKTDPTNPALWVTVYTLNARDDFARTSQDTDADGYSKTYAYDELNRITQITHPDSTTEQYFYVDNAVPTKYLIEVCKIKDRGGNYTKYNYNPNRGLSSVVNALNQTVSYEYCRCAGLYSLTDERGKITVWDRDLNGRVTSKQYHDGKAVLYDYEPESGRLSSVDYPKDASLTLINTYYKDGIIRKTDYTDSGTPDVTVHTMATIAA